VRGIQAPRRSLKLLLLFRVIFGHNISARSLAKKEGPNHVLWNAHFGADGGESVRKFFFFPVEQKQPVLEKRSGGGSALQVGTANSPASYGKRPLSRVIMEARPPRDAARFAYPGPLFAVLPRRFGGGAGDPQNPVPIPQST